MLHHIRRLIREERGATMVEYALMVSLIAVVSLAVVAAVGTGVWNAFDQTNTAVQAPNGSPRPPTTPEVP
jgi:pilus assembly protein Flp/PilA